MLWSMFSSRIFTLSLLWPCGIHPSGALKSSLYLGLGHFMAGWARKGFDSWRYQLIRLLHTLKTFITYWWSIVATWSDWPIEVPMSYCTAKKTTVLIHQILIGWQQEHCQWPHVTNEVLCCWPWSISNFNRLPIFCWQEKMGHFAWALNINWGILWILCFDKSQFCFRV